VPDFVASALKMVGDMTLPLLMIILGGNIYIDFKDKGRIYPMETAKFVVVKKFW
jgi:hypothetical protein